MLRTFWHISQEPEFSQIWDLCRKIANNILFHYRTNSVRIKDKTFQYIQKTLFLAIFDPFSQFLEQNKFSRVSGCDAQLHMGFQHHAKIQKKLIIQFQENAQTDRRTDGGTDRPYFVCSFTTTSARFREFDVGNMTLFHIKVFARIIKETTLTRYFIKVIVYTITSHQANKQFIKCQSRKYVTKIQLYLLLI